MSNVDNDTKAPIIPAGTEPNLYGKTQAFERDNGQAEDSPAKTEEEETTQTDSSKAPEEGDDGSTFEELAAKKGWKSPDDLAKAYSSLEKEATRKSMAISELIDIKLGNQSNQTDQKNDFVEQVQQVQQTHDVSQDEAIKIVNDLIDRKMRPLQEKLAIQETFKDPKDMQYAADVAELIKKNPNIPWDVALKAVKYDKSGKSLREQGKKEAYQEIEKKRQASAQSPKSSPQQPMDADRMKELINDKNIPFSELQRIMKERFSQ